MKLLKDTKFLSDVKKFYNQNKKEILDIILFGSSVRGKEKPEDIDLLILYKDDENLELNFQLKRSLKEYNIQIVSKTYNSLISELFKAREAFLLEGYSLIKRKFIAESLGFFNGILFRYNLKGKTKSEKMRFYYSLYGREKKDNGILKKYSLIKFSNSSLLSPVSESEKVKEYLKSWNIKYDEFPILVPKRLKNIL